MSAGQGQRWQTTWSSPRRSWPSLSYQYAPRPLQKRTKSETLAPTISNPNFVDFFIQIENVFAGTTQGAEVDEDKFTKIMDEVSGWTFGPGVKLDTDEPPP